MQWFMVQCSASSIDWIVTKCRQQKYVIECHQLSRSLRDVSLFCRAPGGVLLPPSSTWQHAAVVKASGCWKVCSVGVLSADIIVPCPDGAGLFSAYLQYETSRSCCSSEIWPPWNRNPEQTHFSYWSGCSAALQSQRSPEKSLLCFALAACYWSSIDTLMNVASPGDILNKHFISSHKRSAENQRHACLTFGCIRLIGNSSSRLTLSKVALPFIIHLPIHWMLSNSVNYQGNCWRKIIMPLITFWALKSEYINVELRKINYE